MTLTKIEAWLAIVLALGAMVGTTTVDLAAAQGRGDGARQERGARGGGSERVRTGGGGGERARAGGGGRPEARSVPDRPRFAAPSRPAFAPTTRSAEPRARPSPALRDFNRATREVRRSPVELERRRPQPERRFEQPRISRPPMPEIRRPPAQSRPGPVVVERRARPDGRRGYRPWRPGLRWRFIVVPTVVIAEDLDWCHYHRWRSPGMAPHRDVRCHRHLQWNHPSLRYVEGY